MASNWDNSKPKDLVDWNVLDAGFGGTLRLIIEGRQCIETVINTMIRQIARQGLWAEFRPQAPGTTQVGEEDSKEELGWCGDQAPFY